MPRRPKPHLNKGYWRCRIDGVEHHLGKDKAAAHREFHRIMAEKGEPVIVPAPVVMSEIVDRWQEFNPSRDYADRLKSFTAHTGATTLARITRDILVVYHRYLKERSLAPKTMRDRVQTAARVLAWARDRGWIDVTPDRPRLAKPVRKARDIPLESITGALESLPTRSGRILRFILETGCRPIEARLLKWSEVDLARAVCVLHAHKTGHSTGKPRTLYLTPASIAVLSAVPRKEDGFVFPTRYGDPYTASGLRSIFKRHTGYTPNQLRHTFAQARSEEIGTAELAKLLGHTDLSTTQYYFQVRDARARRVAGQLSSLAPPSGDDGTPRPKARKKARTSEHRVRGRSKGDRRAI